MINKKELDEIKKQLLDQREELLESLKEISQPNARESDNLSPKFPEYGDKPDENAQEIVDYGTSSRVEVILEKSLADINGALKRIEDGTYGICKYCKHPISPKRLKARPVASTCMSCKTELQENE